MCSVENYHDFTRQINAIDSVPRKQYTMEEVKELFSLFHGVLLARTGADCIDLSSEVMVVLHTAAKL